MRIAILTLPLHTNYGGILQAYALQTVLEGMGHEVMIIDRNRRPGVDISFIVRLKRLILKYIFNRGIENVQAIERYKIETKRNKYIWQFVDKYIKRKEVFCLQQIAHNEFDAIVVGSDQVWRKDFFLNSYPNVGDAFLAFAKGWVIKRIAYAPSLGNEKWNYTPEETAEIKELLSTFDLITLREKDGVELFRKKLHITPEQVLDPTLLLTKHDYELLCGNENTIVDEGGLFCYVLDYSEKKKKLIELVSLKTNLKPFVAIPEHMKIMIPVQEWIACFSRAKFVVTDSFHGCVFSVIFGKPFIVYENENRGNSRFDTLLDILGLKDRLVNDLDGFDMDQVNSDMSAAQKKVSNLKIKSMDLLRKSLGKIGSPVNPRV